MRAVVGVDRVLRTVGVLHLTALVLMPVMMVTMLVMVMLMAVFTLTVVNIVGRVRRCWSGRLRWRLTLSRHTRLPLNQQQSRDYGS
jgi:hypothetical protein